MDISKITNHLYVGTQPMSDDYALLHELEIKLILNTLAGKAPRSDPFPSPIETLWLPMRDNLFAPIPLELFFRGVREALPIINADGKVFVHCKRGRHRSAAMASAILIARGMSAKDAMALIRAKRPIARPNTWYIRRRIIQFEKLWRENPGNNI